MPETAYTLPELRAGVYQHYKGPLYLVLGYSHNASDENNPQVLYIGLELDQAKTGPRFATRDVAEFGEMVDGKPRFNYLGPIYEP